MITIRTAHGFRLQFSNKWSISVVIGYGTHSQYGDSEEAKDDFFKEFKHGSCITSDDCEVAVFNPDGDWQTRQVFSSLGMDDPQDDVTYHTTTDELARIIAYIANR